MIDVSGNISALADSIKEDFGAGRSVALGFESPLFIPVPFFPENLSRGRLGETNRSCLAPAGGYVTTLGLHQAAWILRAVHTAGVSLTVDSKDWPPPDHTRALFCWEAFISRGAKARCPDHHRIRPPGCDLCSWADRTDAASAVNEFVIGKAAEMMAEAPLSLLGTAALWSGWRVSKTILHQPTAVYMPTSAVKRERLNQID
jgi:hypothetical protein